MLGLLDIYIFESNKNGYQKLTEKLHCNYESIKRLGNNPKIQSVGGYQESWDLEGTLILKNIYTLTPLKLLAKLKKPITLILPNDIMIYRVVITDIDIEKDIFLKGGEEVRKKFKVNLERYYGDNEYLFNLL